MHTCIMWQMGWQVTTRKYVCLSMPHHNYVQAKCFIRQCMDVNYAYLQILQYDQYKCQLWKIICWAYEKYGLMSMTNLQSKQKPTGSELIKFAENLT